MRSLDRLFDGRLEAVREIQDDAGGLDAFDVARRELDVVRLGARRREVVDLERRAAGPLRREGEGIERRHDAVPTSGRRRAAAGGQQGDQEQGGNDSHLLNDNRSQERLQFRP